MTTGATRSLFDPTRLVIPTRDELIGASPWVAEVPGLAEQAKDWAEHVVAVQPRLREKARELSSPGIDGAMAAAMGRVLGNVAWVALVDVISAILEDNPDEVEDSDDVGAGKPSGAGRDGEGADTADEEGEAEGASRQPSKSVERVERLVRGGGPAWVKLGQFIATADGLMPAEWVRAFEWCRDEAPPLSKKVPRRIVRRAFGCRVRDIFAEFDDEPIGSASIAQVHRAVLHDGRKVVVKIRRPGLRKRFAYDIRAMAGAARIAERAHPVGRAANPRGFVELFAQLVLEELDFRIEALSMVELGAAAEHAGADYVRFPRPIPGLVTERVLVMEHLPGVAYSSAEVDRETGEQLLRFAIQGVLEHTLIYGVFHGDLHAGNVLLDGSGVLSLIDFGIVGRIEGDQRHALGRFLVAFAQMNVLAQLEAMVDFGAIPADMDLIALTAEIEREVRPYELDENSAIDALVEAISKLVQVLARHRIQLPKELVLFFKNLLYLNGFAAAVAPGAMLMAEVGPVLGYFQEKYSDAVDISALASD